MAEYSEYKDSGIPWIGKIPSHWEVSNRVDYRRYIYWRKRNGHSRPHRDHAPEGLVEMEVTDIPSPASRRSAGRANVRIEFENGLLFERRGMEVDLLAEFIDRIRPALCLS